MGPELSLAKKKDRESKCLKMLMKHLGVNLSIIYEKQELKWTYRKLLDVSLAKKYGWVYKTSLEVGLSKTIIDYLKKNVLKNSKKKK